MKVITYQTFLDEDRSAKLVKEKIEDYPSISAISVPEDAVSLMRNRFWIDKKTEEYLYMLSIDSDNCLIGVFEIGHGNINSAIVDIRGMMMKNLLCNASGFMLIHNHPSGNPSPSKQDIVCTKKVKKAADIMELVFLDHIIIGNDFHVSMRQKDLI